MMKFGTLILAAVVVLEAGSLSAQTPCINCSGSGVSQIVAGTNVTISPSGGTGVVTVNSSGAGVYLPITGGTLTGALNGTSASFSGTVAAGAVVSAPVVTVTGTPTNPTDAATVAYVGAYSSAVTAYAPTSYYAFGDSITAGVNVTNTQNRYANRIANFLQIQGGSTYGVPGNFINAGAGGQTTCGALATQVLPNYAPTIAQQQPFITWALIKNDQGSIGTYYPTFESCYNAAVTWLTIPSQNKTMGTAGTTTGTCATDTTYAQAHGTLCTASASTVSLMITTTGGPIYIWYRLINSDTGTFTYTLDGGSATSVTTSPAPLMNTGDGTSASVGSIRIAPPAAGSHTVLFTQTAAGNMGIIGIGTPSTGLSPSVPYVVVLPDTPEQDGANASLVTLANSYISAMVTQLKADGLNVIQVNPAAYLIATTAANDIAGVHPNDAGDGELAAAFLAVVPGLRPGVSPGSLPFYYCYGASLCAVSGNQVIFWVGTDFTLPTEPAGTVYIVNNFTNSLINVTTDTSLSSLIWPHMGQTFVSSGSLWSIGAADNAYVPQIVDVNGGSYAVSSLMQVGTAIIDNYSATANLTLTGVQGGTITIPPLGGVQLHRPGNGNWYLTALATPFVNQWGTPTYTAATGCSAPVAVSGITNTNMRGEVSISCTIATTGAIGTINLAGVGNGVSASAGAPGACQVTENGGTHGIGWGPFAYSAGPTQSFPITASVSVASSTVIVDYVCQL